jgi:hypothetical protein
VPEPPGRRIDGRRIIGRKVADLRPVQMKFVVNGSLELGRSGVNSLGQRESVVAHADGPQSAHVRLHPAADIAVAHGMLSVPAEMNFHESDPIDVPLQRTFDHAFDPERQFIVTVNVLVGVDSNLHFGSASFTKSCKPTVAKNMPHGYTPFDRCICLSSTRNAAVAKSTYRIKNP